MRTPTEILDDPNTFVGCTKCGGGGVYTSPNTGGGGTCSVCWGKGRTFTKEGKVEYKAAKETALETKRAPLNEWIASLRTAASKLFELPLSNSPTHDEEMVYCEARETLSFEQKQEMRARDMLESIANQAHKWGDVTDKQKAAADKLLVRLAAPKKVTPPVETGKGVVVTGVIVSIKSVDNPYAYNATTLKMVVEDDRGFRVYGTLPSRLQYPCPRDEGGCIVVEDKKGNETWYRYPDKGDRCSFKANVEQSNDDESFGFYKRPTKVKAL